MARVRLPAIAMMVLLGAGPALAQFTDIFSDGPPRPPGNVPRGQPPQQAPNVAPADLGRGRDVQSGATATQSGNWVNPDLPPAQPLPAPMNLPPSSRPGRGGIQSDELAPLPGTNARPGDLTPMTPVAPSAPAGQQPQNAGPNPVQTLPGLPPGQRQPPGTPTDAALQPGDEVVVEPPPQRIANPTAVFNGLDKITGRIISFDVAIDETVQFGALRVTPRVCYSRPPTETPNTDAFTQVDEVTLNGEIKRIFSGWMFAASPGLNAVEHPTYDVWLTDCKGGTNPNVADAAEAKKPAPAAAPAQRAPQPRPTQPRTQQPAGNLLPPLR
ncbi:DUF2155 domain-containing protein [Undibacter mobilis]|uniref:DUF2155 domain-containing protein n=1 Tax=Undibacter mobilis TaxID=2292256 RepID=A0A371BD47_9BRAD|nr:DUF2155 domain-containing protein [Undibacter mobilis]RDV05536.1 DUF2155 domain-containing protein [Undibacter mobilis]